MIDIVSSHHDDFKLFLLTSSEAFVLLYLRRKSSLPLCSIQKSVSLLCRCALSHGLFFRSTFSCNEPKYTYNTHTQIDNRMLLLILVILTRFVGILFESVRWLNQTRANCDVSFSLKYVWPFVEPLEHQHPSAWNGRWPDIIGFTIERFRFLFFFCFSLSFEIFIKLMTICRCAWTRLTRWTDSILVNEKRIKVESITVRWTVAHTLESSSRPSGNVVDDR